MKASTQPLTGSNRADVFSSDMHRDVSACLPCCSEADVKLLLFESLINKLKTTPTPNKNGSYGIKGGVRMPYFGGPYAIFSVEIP